MSKIIVSNVPKLSKEKDGENNEKSMGGSPDPPIYKA